MIIHPFIQAKPPFIKLLYFITIVFISLFFINLLGILVAVPFYGKSFLNGLSGVYNYEDPSVISRLKYLQIISQLSIFIIPVVIFALFTGKNIPDYLKLNRKIQFITLLAGITVMIACLPFINWLSDLNSRMVLPGQLAGVEKWMRNSESEAGMLTNTFLGTPAWGSFLVNILMIAILPAVGEEFFFRGVLQRVFTEWFRNAHVAIIVTAFIFSAIHLQFYGFIPRFLLGMFLGYLFYWSGTLWLPVIMHFINNGMAVIVAFIAARGAANVSFETFGSSNNYVVIIGSGIIVAGLTFFIYTKRNRLSSESKPFL